MDKKSFVRIFTESTMTQQEMANYLRVNIRTVQRYLIGEVPVIGPVEKLAELLDAKNNERNRIK